ncbi:unnamed protein product [Mytilus coruscus]|uniref:Uncharacterized protein n=1 Tax=Mytilus coruscus TaxID=42192 RepID=A0A6J8D627_MYTCO|nr:unnamed protein product [Mytilus coruscus]
METSHKLYYMFAVFILYSVLHCEASDCNYYYYSYDDCDHTLSVGGIVGIVIGCLLFLAVVIVITCAVCGILCFSHRSNNQVVTVVPSNNVSMFTAQQGYPQMQQMNYHMGGPAYLPPPPAYYDNQHPVPSMQRNVFQTPTAPSSQEHNSRQANPFLTTTDLGNYNR